MRYLSLLIIGALLGAGSMYYAGKDKMADGKVKIITETKTITKWKYERIPAPEVLKECYISPIQIEAVARDNWVDVTAYDDCKKADKSFMVYQSSGWRYYAIIGISGAFLGGYTMYRILK